MSLITDPWDDDDVQVEELDSRFKKIRTVQHRTVSIAYGIGFTDWILENSSRLLTKGRWVFQLPWSNLWKVDKQWWNWESFPQNWNLGTIFGWFYQDLPTTIYFSTLHGMIRPLQTARRWLKLKSNQPSESWEEIFLSTHWISSWLLLSNPTSFL